MILKSICLSILSLVSLPLSLQSPVQGGGALEKDDVVVTSAVETTAGVSPVTALTSKTTTTIIKRDATGISSTPLITVKPTPALTTPSALSTTLSSAVPTKTGLKNCNVQGTASDLLTSNLLGARHAADILTCQLECMYRSRCEAYSYEKPTEDVENCQFYTTLIDGKSKVILSSNSGVFFSDKYPSDGSNFCYGSTTL